MVLLAIAGGLLFSPIFKIKKIGISGLEDVNAALVESYVRSYIASGSLTIRGGNILFIDGKKIEEKIKAEFPIIEEARLKKDILKRVVSVELIEKKSIGIWCVESRVATLFDAGASLAPCFYLEKEGSIFKEAPPVEGSLVLLIKTQGASEIPPLGAKVIEKNFLNFLLETKENLFSLVNIGVKEFLFKSGSFDVRAMTTEGFWIFFDGKKNPTDQVVNLKIMLEEKIKEERANLEYIDLREGNRIYYKLKGEEE